MSGPASGAGRDKDLTVALEALDISAESLRGAEAMFRAIHELALTDSPATWESRRRFLAELARVGICCAAEWATAAEASCEAIGRDSGAATTARAPR